MAIDKDEDDDHPQPRLRDPKYAKNTESDNTKPKLRTPVPSGETKNTKYKEQNFRIENLNFFTSSECSSRSGTSDGNCAAGFGLDRTFDFQNTSTMLRSSSEDVQLQSTRRLLHCV